MISIPNCISCKHFHGDSANPACDAFGVIPEKIWTNQADHRKPYPGDGGIQFERREGSVVELDWPED